MAAWLLYFISRCVLIVSGVAHMASLTKRKMSRWRLTLKLIAPTGDHVFTYTALAEAGAAGCLRMCSAHPGRVYGQRLRTRSSRAERGV